MQQPSQGDGGGMKERRDGLAAIASATIVSLRVAGGMVRGKPALNPVISDPAGRPNAGA
jgi:hypothetical protein